MAGNLADVITCAKFQDEISRGYDFTGGGVELPIFLLIFAWALQQCSATALPAVINEVQMNEKQSIVSPATIPRLEICKREICPSLFFPT